MIGCHVESVFRVNFQFFVPERGTVVTGQLNIGQRDHLVRAVASLSTIFGFPATSETDEHFLNPFFLRLCLLYTRLNSSHGEFSVLPPPSLCSPCISFTLSQSHGCFLRILTPAFIPYSSDLT